MSSQHNLKKASMLGRFFNIKEEQVPQSRVYAEKMKLDVVTEHMREGVILLSSDQDVLFANAMIREMLRLSEHEGSSKNILEAFSKKFQKVELDTCLHNATHNKPFIIPEVESDSEIYRIRFSQLPKDEIKKSGASQLIWVENITEAKTLERRKSEFVSVVAHQLRTPLSGLKWTLHMLINGDLGKMTDEQKTFLLKSYENNERMITLVNDMLATDRIESGRLKYTLMRINIRDLVENVLFEVFPNARRRGVNLDFVKGKDGKFIALVDPQKIRAVIQNLLENSIKYTMKGGSVVIGLEESNKELTIKIADTGIGIPQDQQSQIFTRFFRAGNALKMEPSGSGLGLYMVKKIIEEHGGNIRFESKEKAGSTFYLTIPLVVKKDTLKNKIHE